MTPSDKFQKYRLRQSLDELKRKADKARRRAIWTLEDIDLARAEANEIGNALGLDWAIKEDAWINGTAAAPEDDT
jgi:hypothetical protein